MEKEPASLRLLAPAANERGFAMSAATQPLRQQALPPYSPSMSAKSAGEFC